MSDTVDARSAARPTDVRIVEGSVVILRLYDVAHGIDLQRAEAVAAAAAPTGRARLTRTKPKAVAFGEAPLELALGTVDVPANSTALAAEVTARAYDFGAVSIAVRIAVADASWDELVGTVQEADRVLQESAAGLWSGLLDRLRSLIGPALIRPSATTIDEDYLITTVRRFDPPLSPREVLDTLDVAALLSRDPQPLSDMARRELLRHTFAYYTTDLAVLTWDHAFLIEPAGDRDVADVLEVANAQLLEMRYYDELLDDELPRMYDRVERARPRHWWPSVRFARLARELYRLVAEVTEITERVENALIVTEDVYLARIYGTALEQFRLPAWTAGVDRKLAIIRDNYRALYDESATTRAEHLEAAIVILIVFEIVLAFIL